MKKLIIRLIIFLIPIAVCIFIVEYALREIPNDYSYKNTYLQKNAKDIEVLILGNSHAYRGIIPESIEFNTFNAAYISQTLNLDYLIFNKYKNTLNSLKYLIIVVSYPSLFSSLETGVESWRLKNYNLYYNFNLTENPNNYSEFLSNNFDINKLRMEQYYKYGNTQITCSKLGGGYIEGHTNLEKSAIEAAKRHTKIELPYFKKYINDLEVIIEFTNKNGIKIIFITPPAYKTYVENIDRKQLELMNQILDSLTGSSNNVYRINLLNSTKYMDEDFLDADHLNKKGAVKLTKELNMFLKDLEY